MRKRGRPSLPKGQLKEVYLVCRVLESEAKEIESAAQSASKTKSEFMREILLNAVRAKIQSQVP